MNFSLKIKRPCFFDLCLLLVLLSLLLPIGCGSGGEGEGSDTTLPPSTQGEQLAVVPGAPKSLSIDPHGVQIPVGGQQNFSATIDDAASADVAWSVQEGDAGGTITSDGIYTAPARPGTYHVIATFKEDTELQAATEVTVISQGAIRVEPATLFLGPSGKHPFSATVTETADTAVSWSVKESGGGTISVEGDYTAPTATGTYHVVASGRSDPSLQGEATVTVSSLLPKGIACSLSPRLPYLAWVSSNAAVIAWRCNPNGSVHWGPGQDRSRLFSDNTDKDQHFAVLSDLSPGTTYSYEVEVDGTRLGSAATFTTAPAQGSEASLIAFADSGSGTDNQTRLAEVMKRSSFDFALIAGDVIYERGSDAEYDPHYFRPYGAIINHLPFFPVVGNHDIVTEAGGPFRKNFYLPKGTFYYDFFWGDIHVIALDSNKVTDPKQLAWLEKTLQRPARWKVVYFHHPAFSSAAEYGDTPAVQSKWVPLFEKYGVDLVLNGHAHGYERMVPINGVTYIVTGGGGAWLYPVGRNERTAISISTHEFVSVRVTADAMTLNTVDLNGNVVDTFQIDKTASTNPS